MQYLAKITREQRIGNLLKYDFIDIKTREEGCFYHTSRLNDIPHLPGKLDISFDDEERCYFLQSFIQINITAEEYKHLETLFPLVDREWKKGIEEVENEITKRKKKKLTFQEINYLLQKNLSRKEIADYANVSIWNIHRIISKGKRGIVKSKKKRGRPRKIDGYDLNVLYSYFLNDRATTQQERADYLWDEIGLKVHRSTISRTFKRDKFTRKRATKQYLELDVKKAKQFIKDNYQLFSSPYCLAVDEFGVNLGETSRYAYARKACRAIISRKGQKGFNHTVILCVRNINNQSVVSYKIIKNDKKNKDKKDKNKEVKKGTDAIDFYNFLKNIKLPTNDQYFLFLDNSRIHSTSKKMKDLGFLSMEELARQKNVILIYLPSYAPMINPAELCINFIKSYIRGKRFWNEEELIKTIKEAVDLLNQKDLTKWFLSCRNYFKIDL